MNPIWTAAAESVSYVNLMGAMTLTFIGVFLAWTWWAWAPGNRDAMDRAALLPFADDEVSP